MNIEDTKIEMNPEIEIERIESMDIIPAGCLHQWRVISEFYDDSKGRDVRIYPFYCVHCLTVKTVLISRQK